MPWTKALLDEEAWLLTIAVKNILFRKQFFTSPRIIIARKIIIFVIFRSGHFRQQANVKSISKTRLYAQIWHTEVFED